MESSKLILRRCHYCKHLIYLPQSEEKALYRHGEEHAVCLTNPSCEEKAQQKK